MMTPGTERETPRPLLVGEANPFGGGAEWALFPRPTGSSGDRLRRLVFGVTEETYLASFSRANLFPEPPVGRWRAHEASRAAEALAKPPVVIGLGKKVAAAFGVAGALPVVRAFNDFVFVGIPHPSGRCHAWSDPETLARCRELLREALPEISFGEIEEVA